MTNIKHTCYKCGQVVVSEFGSWIRSWRRWMCFRCQGGQNAPQ